MQMLSRRFDFEKEKVEENIRSINQAPRTSILPACCVFLPDMFCQRSSFDCWLETLPIADDASFFLDTRLLQNLSTFALTVEEEQCQNLSPIALTDDEEQCQNVSPIALTDGDKQRQVRFSFLNYIKYFCWGLWGTTSLPHTRGKVCVHPTLPRTHFWDYTGYVVVGVVYHVRFFIMMR